ncbi:hypothetical protein BP951000_1556 [Brachyspira pilosicoli 95/1000]|uniref:Uncharacterized protein n=1 Tax=Brachyspira pilosicoli (strain ATCC BAA-1826 / 95/1000) TaxID=759914 RepID=D8IEG6_BRAP9|nr:hypothetical protein BP951000_1556 [Brachyspira pilosicoli 95/1000]
MFCIIYKYSIGNISIIKIKNINTSFFNFNLYSIFSILSFVFSFLSVINVPNELPFLNLIEITSFIVWFVFGCISYILLFLKIFDLYLNVKEYLFSTIFLKSEIYAVLLKFPIIDRGISINIDIIIVIIMYLYNLFFICFLCGIFLL